MVSCILQTCSAQDFLRMSPEQRLSNYGALCGTERLVRIIGRSSLVSLIVIPLAGTNSHCDHT